jgi:valyl-tRNA synthetase
VNEALTALAVDDAAQRIYNFVWDEFCDWYVELAKPRLAGASSPVPGGEGTSSDVREVLLYVLERTLRLAHPFMPFITEAIWQSLPGAGESLMIARYPQPDSRWLDLEAEARMSVVMEVTRALRNLRAELGVAPSQRVEAAVLGANGELEAHYVESLARATVCRERPEGKSIAALAGGLEVLLPVAGLVDVERERERIESDLAAVQKELARVNGKLGNAQFLERAPRDVVEKERRILAELEEKKAKLEARLQGV